LFFGHPSILNFPSLLNRDNQLIVVNSAQKIYWRLRIELQNTTEQP